MRWGLLWTQGIDQVQSVGNAPTGSINSRLDSCFNLGARPFLGEYGGLPRVRPLITWRDLTWYCLLIWHDLWCDVTCCRMSSAAHEAWSEGSASFGHHAQSETYQLHEALITNDRLMTAVVEGAKQTVFPCLSRGTVRYCTSKQYHLQIIYYICMQILCHESLVVFLSGAPEGFQQSSPLRSARTSFGHAVEGDEPDPSELESGLPDDDASWLAKCS